LGESGRVGRCDEQQCDERHCDILLGGGALLHVKAEPAPCRFPRSPVEGGVLWRRRIAAALTAASFLGFSAWELTRRVHPWGDLSNGFFTDHFSHMNGSRLFLRVGAREWTTPLARMLPRLTPAERAALPADVVDCPDGCLFRVDGWPRAKPMQQSWPTLTRRSSPSRWRWCSISERSITCPGASQRLRWCSVPGSR